MRDPNFRQPFDQLNPPKSVTDPLGLGAQNPHRKCLHKAGVSADGGPIVLEVTTPEEQAAAIADGWFLNKNEALAKAAEAEAQGRRDDEETRAQRNKAIEGLFSQSTVGRNIEKFRKECGWTFQKMAEKVGISKDAVNEHVNHKVPPRVTTLKAYADVFSAALGRVITVEDLERE